MAFSSVRLSNFILRIEERNRSGHLNACGIHVENIWPYAINQQQQLLVSHKFSIPNPSMIRSSLFEHIINAMTHRQFFLSLHISSEQFILRMRRRCRFFYFFVFAVLPGLLIFCAFSDAPNTNVFSVFQNFSKHRNVSKNTSVVVVVLLLYIYMYVLIFVRFTINDTKQL